MKKLLLPAVIVASLIACGDPTSSPDSESKSDWLVVAADGVSAGEMALRSWCDPGATPVFVSASSTDALHHLRLAAADLRARAALSQQSEILVAHDRLVKLAEFVAAINHLASIVTSTRFIHPSQQVRSLDPSHRALIYSVLTEEEKGRRGDVGKESEREDPMELALRRYLNRQSEAVKEAVAYVKGGEAEIVQSANEAESESLLAVDATVVTSASACVRRLVEEKLSQS